MMDDGAGSSGLYSWYFSPTAENEIWFSTQMPHTMALDSELRFHVHWMQTTTTTGNIVFQFEYMWVDISGTKATSTLVTVTVTGGGSSYVHNVSQIQTITNTGQGISSILFCRFARLGNDSADTNPAGTFLLFADVHFKKDTNGSREEYMK